MKTVIVEPSRFYASKDRNDHNLIGSLLEMVVISAIYKGSIQIQFKLEGQNFEFVEHLADGQYWVCPPFPIDFSVEAMKHIEDLFKLREKEGVKELLFVKLANTEAVVECTACARTRGDERSVTIDIHRHPYRHSKAISKLIDETLELHDRSTFARPRWKDFLMKLWGWSWK